MADVRISAIVAIDEKKGMGKDGGIPWHIPGEQRRFKKITMGHPIIMGRKTFTSIGKILPGRSNIVITRDINQLRQMHPSVLFQEVVPSLSEALTRAKNLPGSEEIFVIGGGEIFKEVIPYLDRLYLTIIEKDFNCDTFFPDFSEFTKLIEKEEHTFEDTSYTYLTLDR